MINLYVKQYSKSSRKDFLLIRLNDFCKKHPLSLIVSFDYRYYNSSKLDLELLSTRINTISDGRLIVASSENELLHGFIQFRISPLARDNNYETVMLALDYFREQFLTEARR